MRIRALGWLGLSQSRTGCSSCLLLVTAAYLLVGVAAFAGWRITGRDAWVESFFQIPGALLACFLAAAQVWFSLRVLGSFSPEEPMHRAWLCLAGSAAFDLTGTVATQILCVETKLNPLVHTSWWSLELQLHLQEYGALLGGTCRFTLLAAGLWGALKVHRQSGLLGRVTLLDWVAWAAMGAYVAREAWDVVAAIQRGKVFSPVQIAGWPVDLLLWISLAQAILLYRSAQQMKPGWIGRCWNAFAIGVFLVCLGVGASWASNWGYLPWPWSSLIWYIWLPAAAAFALAPAYQLEAIQRAYAAPDGGIPE